MKRSIVLSQSLGAPNEVTITFPYGRDIILTLCELEQLRDLANHVLNEIPHPNWKQRLVETYGLTEGDYRE